MSGIKIRPAVAGEEKKIGDIYEGAKKFQRQTGNMHQWTGAYPGEESAREDIANGKLYVIEQDGEIHGVFFFDCGIEPTYLKICDGQWPCDLPYGFIHRIAGDGAVHGIVRLATEWALERCDRVRIDTHRDNSVMQKALASAGYKYCGIIHLSSGDERLAFQIDAQEKDVGTLTKKL